MGIARRVCEGLVLAGMLSGCAAAKSAAVQSAMHEIWDEGNLARIDEAYAPEVANAIKEFVVEYRTVYPDIEVEIVDSVVQGDRIVTLWTVRGTHKDLGKRVELDGVSVRTIGGGKIVDEQMYYDMKTVYDQLGFRMTPPDGATPFGPVSVERPEPVEPPAAEPAPGEAVPRPE